MRGGRVPPQTLTREIEMETNYRIIEIRDAEGRRAYQIAAEGHEPSGTIFYSRAAAEKVAREDAAAQASAD